MIKRGWISAVLVFLMVVAALGSVAAQEGMSTIIIGTTDEPSGIDGGYAYAFHDWELLKNTGDALMGYVPGTTQLIPRLAIDFPKVSDDGLVYTFTLREGIQFADGTPLTAQIEADSINRAKELDGDIAGFVNGFVESVEALDELTVQFTLTQQYGFFPAVAATGPFIPMNPNQYPRDAFNNAPERIDGVGPYKLVEYVVGEQIVLERNENYWDKESIPNIDRVIIRYFADPTTMALSVENGEIDIAWRTLGPVEAVRLQDIAGLNVTTVDASSIRYMAFNTQMEPVNDPMVRAGIAAAIDRETLVDRVFEGRNPPLYSMVPMTFPMATEAFLDEYGFQDLDMAIELLEGAGYSADNKLGLEFWYPPEHYGTTTADQVQVLKEQLEETGLIEVSLMSQNWATYIAAATDGEYPAYILGWFPDYADPDTWLAPFGSCVQSAGLGINYCNEEMDAFLLGGGAETDPAVRADLYSQAQALWATEVPTIPLFMEPEFITVRDGIDGVAINGLFEFNYGELLFVD
jgi:peptide/nickel transport system substrate-binding protein